MKPPTVLVVDPADLRRAWELNWELWGKIAPHRNDELTPLFDELDKILTRLRGLEVQ